MYMAEPAPATNRQASSCTMSCENPEPTIPMPVTNGPPTSNRRRPNRSAITPSGTFNNKRASANDERVSPIAAVPTPNSFAKSGRIGLMTP